MRAYLLNKTGGPDVLKIQDVEEPDLGKDQVRIKVNYIGINYAEILSRKGQYTWAPKKPYVPGMEGVGEVVEIGSKVNNHNIGDKVIFGSQYGSYAEQIVVPSYMAFPLLIHMSEEENAAFLVNYMTAWIALFKLARIIPEDKVLIQAAAGGVGTAAVQLAKSYGCTVYGTASNPDKLALLINLGIDDAINYKTTDFYSVIKQKEGGIDVVLELVGGDVYKKSLELLNPFGRVVVAGFASIPFQKWNPVSWWKTWKRAPKVKMIKMARASYGVMATHIGYLTNHKDVVNQQWKELTGFINERQIKPVIGGKYSFKELPKAHQFIESRKSYGKVVVAVD